MSPRAWLVLVAITGVGGCGSMLEVVDDDTTTTTGSTGATPGSTGDATPTTAGTTQAEGSSGADDTGTSTTDDGGYEEDDGSNGCTFTCPNPPPPTPPPGGGSGGFLECDLAAQDCPDGEKCMPWANDGGPTWNATRCSPIDPDPDHVGEPCTVEGGPTSGIDSCDRSHVCWQVDPQTNEGLCYGLCEVDVEGPSCEAPLACAEIDVAQLCVQPCDPLDPLGCPEGTACGFFMGSALACQPAPPGSATLGTPCDASLPCEAGTLCSYDAALDCGNAPGAGCCATPCSVSDPAACTGPATCSPWFPEPAPPGLADLGVCV